MPETRAVAEGRERTVGGGGSAGGGERPLKPSGRAEREQSAAESGREGVSRPLLGEILIQYVYCIHTRGGGRRNRMKYGRWTTKISMPPVEIRSNAAVELLPDNFLQNSQFILLGQNRQFRRTQITAQPTI